MPMPAAGEHGEAGQVASGAAGERREETDVVAVQVDAVVAGPGNGDLELAGQVGGAVDGLDVVDRCEHLGDGACERCQVTPARR